MKHAWLSVHRIALVAGNTTREAVRQRLFAVLLVIAVSLVIGGQYLREFNFGTPELKFIADVGFGVIGLCGAVLAVSVTAQLFFSELEQRTVLTLLARPIGRGEYVLGKYLGAVTLAAGFCAGLTALLATVLWARETSLMRDYPAAFRDGRVVCYAAVAATGWLQGLKLAVLTAMTLLVACFSQNQIFAALIGYLVMAICHLQYLAQDASARADAPLLRALARAVGWVFPNFQVFGEGTVAAGGVGGAALYAMGYVVAACVLAIECFRRREI